VDAAGGAWPRPQAELRRAGALPPWLGNEALHRSHRSSLVRKDPAWYRPRFPDVPDDLPYVWPV
ncbi:MAG: cytoplasmic protein, partial [Chloroflexota bacterium]